MTNAKGFSHITVTADDDDDVVIQAGIVAPAPDAETEPGAPAGAAAGNGEEPPAEATPAAGAAEAGVPAAPAADEAGVPAAAPSPCHPERSAQRAVEGSPAAPAARKAPAAPAAAPDDGYRETTLADLEGARMSKTQKAVIAVAILGIVAFAVWYLFAR